MDDPLVAHLRACCVQVMGARPGCGFFVTPHLIVTCAHVVGAGVREGAQVHLRQWEEGAVRSLDPAMAVAMFPDDDLAFLQTDRAHPAFAPLSGEVQMGNPLIALGYPRQDDHETFDQFSAMYEGPTQFLDAAGRVGVEAKFKAGQVEPGYSGGPLLNLQTGRVMGVVVTTRDRRSDLGGWAIEISVLTKCLEERGIQLPSVDPQWTDAEAKQRVGAKRVQALRDHAEYQRWMFEEQPLFGKEPFALAHVYVDTECGKLTWGEIRDSTQQTSITARSFDLTTGSRDVKKRVDPFSEQFGSRQLLSHTVMELLGDPEFKDAIVIQGVAGSGKSAFTLWLSAELLRQGLRPIRVLLRDLRLERTRPISEALAQAVRLTDKTYQPLGLPYSRPEDLFLGGSIFNQSLYFGNARICPYVLILDGWDEISISASEGFKSRLDHMLEQLRTEFLHNREIPVRVIITGRLSATIADSTFLHQKTPILTIRPLKPEHLEEFVSKVSQRLQAPPLTLVEGSDWHPFEVTRLSQVFARYREDFIQLFKVENQRTATTGSLEVLGLSLLAYLAIRLLAEPDADIEAIIANPTTLYRHLVDLTCGKAGKYVHSPEEVEHQFRVSGRKLRELLWETAAAMTIYGEESIPYQELKLRLEVSGDELEARVRRASEDHVLSRLMVSYYFKGGHPDLGCEFSHKSFREYLFAEGMVEILKDYGRMLNEPLLERRPHWKEFNQEDPRYHLCRELARRLAPQWLSPEIVAHLEKLLNWEIARSVVRPGDSQATSGQPTSPLDLEDWVRVRDGLADLWDWWAEGVHLRSQPVHNRGQKVQFELPYAQELGKWSMPLNLEHGAPSPTPPQIIAMDAHLGDALFRLCALVHYYIAAQQGWLNLNGDGQASRQPSVLWQGVSEIGKGPRRYQSIICQDAGTWVLFSPAGNSALSFFTYASRINSTGERPSGLFPLGCSLWGIDLRDVVLSLPLSSSRDSNLLAGTRSTWAYANLSGVMASGDFGWLSLHNALALKINLRTADLDGADLSWVDLHEARLDGVPLRGADLRGAKLYWADLHGAYLDGSDLRGADLDGANLEGASLDRANLEGAHLQGAKLQGAKLPLAILQGADLRGADLRGAYLRQAHLQDANLREADLRGADLREARLERACLNKADLGGADLRGARLYDADLSEARRDGAYIDIGKMGKSNIVEG